MKDDTYGAVTYMVKLQKDVSLTSATTMSDLKNIMAGDITAMIEIEGISVINNSDTITFNTATGEFSGANFGDSSKNIAIFGQEGNETYVTAVSVEGGKLSVTADTIAYKIVNNVTVAQSGITIENGQIVGSHLDEISSDGKLNTICGEAVLTNAENNPNAVVFYSDGSWICSNGASFTFTNPPSTDTLLSNLNGLGLTVTGLDNIELPESMTVISNNPEIMLGYILSTQSDEIAAAGLNITVKDGASYTTSEGIVLKENSEFNISIQNGAVALKAVGSGVSAQYDLSKTNWTANTGETLFEETFSNGEYITSAVLLAKAGVTQLTGTEIVWSVSGNKYRIALNIVTDGV
jgi:hypothetical protein